MYILWAGITVLALVWSVTEFINSKKPECGEERGNSPRRWVVGIVLLISALSLLLLFLGGTLCMYFLLILSVEEPLLGRLLGVIVFWPVLSVGLAVCAIDTKIQSFTKPERKKTCTTLTAVTAASIVLYFCFLAATLYFVVW